jgi:hypothetical protein
MSVTESHPERRFVLPAEYYSSATPDAMLPAWVKFGCGGLSLLIMLLVFVGGGYLASGGMVDLMDLVFSMSVGEMRPMYTETVTAAQKAEVEQEIELLRRNLREGKVRVQQLDPVLQTMRRATDDGKVDAQEATSLVEAARWANRPAKTPARQVP